ncbi:MAG: hypothetical protein AAFZ65_02690 [Planctomycetota bacterium]
MNPHHEPSPEFTRFLQWQTRTELRRSARFEAPRSPGLHVPTWARVAALVFLSLFAGGGGVWAMERLQDSRDVELLIERNRLETSLAHKAVGLAQANLERRETLYGSGLVSMHELQTAREQLARAIHDRDRQQVEGAELAAALQPVTRRLSAPRVGARDFVSEGLRIDRALLETRLQIQAERTDVAQARAAQGRVTGPESDRALRDLESLRADLALLDARQALRADFLGQAHDAMTCERLDRALQVQHRIDDLQQETALVQRELDRAQFLQDQGFLSANETTSLRTDLDRLDVELQLATLELELLR